MIPANDEIPRFAPPPGTLPNQPPAHWLYQRLWDPTTSIPPPHQAYSTPYISPPQSQAVITVDGDSSDGEGHEVEIADDAEAECDVEVRPIRLYRSSPFTPFLSVQPFSRRSSRPLASKRPTRFGQNPWFPPTQSRYSFRALNQLWLAPVQRLQRSVLPNHPRSKSILSLWPFLHPI
jgi:hypothetical protein